MIQRRSGDARSHIASAGKIPWSMGFALTNRLTLNKWLARSSCFLSFGERSAYQSSPFQNSVRCISTQAIDSNTETAALRQISGINQKGKSNCATKNTAPKILTISVKRLRAAPEEYPATKVL